MNKNAKKVMELIVNCAADVDTLRQIQECAAMRTLGELEPVRPVNVH